MTYTTAQNLLINKTANYRATNYGKHPKEVFNIDEDILNNSVYNNIINSLDKLETNYNNTSDEIDNLINEARLTYDSLIIEKQLLNAVPTYTYTLPDVADFVDLVNTINSLIADCNNIIININKGINNVNVYMNQLILLEVGTQLTSIINKKWLLNYLNTIPRIPKVKPINSTLICDSTGHITWQ